MIANPLPGSRQGNRFDRELACVCWDGNGYVFPAKVIPIGVQHVRARRYGKLEFSLPRVVKSDPLAAALQICPRPAKRFAGLPQFLANDGSAQPTFRLQDDAGDPFCKDAGDMAWKPICFPARLRVASGANRNCS